MLSTQVETSTVVHMDVQLLVAKVVQSLRQHGTRATVNRVVASLRNRRRSSTADDFDVTHGTDTVRQVQLWEFRIASPNRRFGERYQTTSEQELVDAINFLRENLNTFTFIDLGCGKGRALLVAAHLGFKRLIGVEFAVELVEIARVNLAKMGVANAVVEYADAADFLFPNGDVVLYLYNPFSAEVMQTVVAHLRESHPRKLYVIYTVPKAAEVLDLSGFLSRLGCPPGRPHIQVWRAIS